MSKTALHALVLGLTALTPAARADVHTERLTARVRIVDGVATTTLEAVLTNDTGLPAEADWVLPLPPGAVADDLRITAGGVELAGEVLDADRARGVYESIVRRRRDPALLEYLGRGCLRVRVFPVPTEGEVVLSATYRQVLPELGGLWRWSLAAAAPGPDGRPPGEVVLDLELHSSLPLRNVFSPVGAVEVVHGKASDEGYTARASFEGAPTALERGELALFYGLGTEEFGLNLLSSRPRGEEEGSFLMLLSPARDGIDERVIARSIRFVVDTSGSMKGEKIEQARRALQFFVRSLRGGDVFNVVPFSTEARPFFERPVAASRANVDEALERIAGLGARGGTFLGDGLAAGLVDVRDRERVPIVVLLTDGRPTVGPRKLDELVTWVEKRNVASARIFVLGVGDDLDPVVLDELASRTRGRQHYVRAGESVEEKASDLIRKLGRPVMTDVEVEVDGVRVERVVPRELPDLFAGDRLEIVGRYRRGGRARVRLVGRVAGTRKVVRYEARFADRDDAELDFLTPLWAHRRVGMLLDELRRGGPDDELFGEVRLLGQRYGIVTPYTSQLVVEDALRPTGSETFSRGGTRRTYRGPGDSTAPGGGGGGAGGGPATPGPVTPGSPGAPGPATPTTGGGGRAEPRPVSLERLAEQLREAGVLPADAPDDELEELARDVAREVLAADRALAGLGRQTGAEAVDESVFLNDLMRRGRSSGEGPHWTERFTRRVKGKLFDLRAGVWTDRSLPENEPRRRVVEAFSAGYFALVRDVPALAQYFAFSPRVVVALDGRVYEVRPQQPEGGR